ncbi:phage tail spike protein [Priestia megaterium]|uniref:phage tail spike protein n=1 Tax=Priestia megaterium TaxID=1404 RepID=UPI002860266D|nr:phage tail spike protein [Priestia megaterium]MDR7207606.1 phage minor structural protein [Priestia megaterium]
MIYILDRTQTTVGVASNGSPLSMPYFADKHTESLDDVSTYEFSVPSDHETADLLQVEGHIIIRDLDGNNILFTIKEVQDGRDSGKKIKTVFAENTAVTELLSDVQRPMTMNSTTVTAAVNAVMANSGTWQVGTIEDDNFSIDFSIDDHTTVLDALQQIRTAFNVEMYYTVDLVGTQLVNKKVHFVEKRGLATGVRFDYSYDLIGVSRTENSEQIVTALVAVGKGDDASTRVDLTSLGDFTEGEFYHNQGTDWIASTIALNNWGFNGKHRFGVFIDDESETVERLKERTMKELADRSQPVLTYSASVANLERITGYEAKKLRLGDTIIVNDKSFSTPIVVEARVKQLVRSYTNPSDDEVDLGNYVPLELWVDPRIKALQQKISMNEALWGSSGELIIKQPTQPTGTFNDGQLWLNTDTNVMMRYNASTGTWEKVTREDFADLAGQATESQIANDAITRDKLIDGAVTGSKLGNGSVSEVKIRDLSVTSAKIAQAAIQAAHIDQLAVGTAAIQDASITQAKIGNLQVGTAQIMDAAINNAKIATAAIGSANIIDGNITNAKIANASVDTAKIKDASITNAKIDRASVNKLVVDTADIKDASITNAKIANLAVSSAQIQDASITNAKLGNASIDNAKIQNASISTAKIQTGAIDTGLIKDGAITSAKIMDAAIGTAQIADASIVDAKIGNISANKISTGTLDADKVTIKNLKADSIVAGALTIDGVNYIKNAKLLKPTGSDWYFATGVSVDTSTTFDGNASIKNIQSGLSADTWTNAIYYYKNTPTTEGQAWVASVYTMTDDVSSFDNGAKMNIDFMDAGGYRIAGFPTVQVVPSKNNEWQRFILTGIAPANTAYVRIQVYIVRNGRLWFAKPMLQKGQIASEWKPSTDELISDGAIDNSKLADNAVDSDVLQDNSVSNSKVQNQAIDTAKIKTAAITTALIADASITNAKIMDLSVSSAKLIDASITTAKVGDAQITNAKIANLAVDNAKIANLAVSTAKIQDLAVDNSKIANATITSAKIGNAQITNALIADLAVTDAKIANATISSAKIASLDAGKITTGFLSSDRIDANAITARQLLIGTWENLFQNPDFEKGSAGWKSASIWSVVNDSTKAYIGSQFAKGTWGSASSVSYYNDTTFPVRAGEQYYIEGYFKTEVSTSTATRTILVKYTDGAGNDTYYLPTETLSTTWTKYSYTFTIPAGTVSMQIGLSVKSGMPSGNATYVDNLYCRKMISGELLVDGSVTANTIKSLNGLNVGNGQFVVDANGNVTLGAGAVLTSVTIKTSTFESLRGNTFYLGDDGAKIDYSIAGTIKRTRYGTNDLTYLAIDDTPVYNFVMNGAFDVTLKPYGSHYGLKLGSPIIKGLMGTDAVQIRNYNDTDYADIAAKNGTFTNSIDVWGASSLKGVTTISASSGGMLKMVGTADSYIEFFPDGTSAGRKGFVGMESATGNNLVLSSDSDEIILRTDVNRVKIDNGVVGVYFRNAADSAYVPIYASAFTVNSLRDSKKDITPFEKTFMDRTALDEILDTTIYNYRLNEENEHDPVHIGLIYEESPMEVVDLRGKGIDSYAMIAMSWQGLKDLNAKLENKVAALEERLAKLEGGTE